jgi:hypothetical protein
VWQASAAGSLVLRRMDRRMELLGAFEQGAA